MEKSYVVIGEASESESEEEIDSSEHNRNAVKTISKSTQGIILTGEASESDDELVEKKSSSPKTDPQLTQELKKKDFSKKYQAPNFDSLLHKKLKERNISLHKDLNDFVNTILNSALKDLNSTNRQLLKSQCHLQEASSSLSVLHSNLNSLKSNLSLISNDKFLANIKLTPNE